MTIELRKYLEISTLKWQIEKNINDYLNRTPDSKQEKDGIEILKRYKDQSTSGDHESRKIIREYIRTLVLRGFNLYEMDEEGALSNILINYKLQIDEESGFIDYIIHFDDPANLTYLEQFEILLYKNHTISQNGRDGAFKLLINKYPIYNKNRETKDYQSSNHEINAADIGYMYEQEHVQLTFAEKIDILAQRLYEEIYGLKALDILAYSDINEVGFSFDGQYIYCWCDRKYHLSFMSLNEDEARIVQERAISFDKSIGALNESNPERLCHRADGARITVTQKPYFSSRNCCIRIFNQSHASYADLINSEKLRLLTTAMVKSGECLCLQGGLGTGKTTLMEVLFEILDDHLHIGLAEEMFEQHIMVKYPNKRIIEAQPILQRGLSLLEVVATFLRMSVDVAGLGEARTGDALYAFIQLRQSVSIAAWLTAHVNAPENTIPRFKNMLMGVGRYTNEQAAVSDIIQTINCIYQHKIIGEQRVVSEVTEIVPLVETSFIVKEDLSLNDDHEYLQKQYYIQQMQQNPSNMYRLNKIMEMQDGIARFCSYPSQRMIDRAKRLPESKVYWDRLLQEMEKDIKRSHNLKLWW